MALTLPSLRTAGDAVQAAGAVLQALSEGGRTPGEGAQVMVMALAEIFRRTLEIAEIEDRVRQPEEVTRGAT